MAQGNVEVWLGTLLTVSQRSLHNIIKQAHVAINDANFQLLEFLNTFPAQVGNLHSHSSNFSELNN